MPTGTRLPDGYSALITADTFPNVEFWVKEPTPPGYNLGGPNNQTTMENVKFRTQKPKKLITVTGASVVVGYATAYLTRIIGTGAVGTGTGMLGKNDLYHVTYADGSKHNFW